MFEEILTDVSREIAKEVLLQYSSRNFMTQEEVEDLERTAEAAAKSKIIDGFAAFFPK